MIIFKSLTYKNFLSVGNKPIEVDYIQNKKVIYTGKNGTGKSTMQDALCFALYNKAFRKTKKEQMVNSINGKDAVVTVEFSIGTKKYKIERGIHPTFCRLYINNELKEMESSARDYQAFIENTILRMSEKTFRQIVVLGSTTYIPFMKLAPYMKRAVVEDLLEVSIFSSMSEVIKRRANILMKDIQEVDGNVKILETSISSKETALMDIDNSRNNSSSKIENELSILNKDLINAVDKYDHLMASLPKMEAEVSEHNSKIKVFKKNTKKAHDLKSKIENNKSRSVKESEYLLDNDSCHVCKQDIDIDFKDHIIFKNKASIEKYDSAISDLKEIINGDATLILESTILIENLSEKMDDIKDAAYEVQTIKTKIDHIHKTNKSVYNDNSQLIKNMQRQIDLLKSELDEESLKRKEIVSDGNCLTYLVNLLKDDGIKSKIIKTYLPIINKYIRKHLDILGLNIDFRFDEFFEETIIAQHKENFSYGNFSTGQQLRIDMAILFTWRELSKLKNSTSTNLLILDEITSSTLDDAGVESFNEIIDIQVTNGDTCIIITHSPDTVIGLPYITKDHKIVNNFTEIVTR